MVTNIAPAMLDYVLNCSLLESKDAYYVTVTAYGFKIYKPCNAPVARYSLTLKIFATVYIEN